jgi:hypothetical protein
MAKGDADDFVRTIEAFAVIARKRNNVVMRKLAFDALDGVLRRSPVDTGRFRGSWRVAVNTIDDGVEDPRESKSSVAQGSSAVGEELLQLGKVAEVTASDVIHISNNLPYADVLEKGSSDQAPNGILEPTFIELAAGLNAAVSASKAQVPDA